MKSILMLLIISIFAIGVPLSAEAQGDPLEKIAMAIQAGNAKALASYFDTNVEISTDKDGIYSKAQAEQVLRDFFEKNKPSSFNIMHQGSSGGNSMYGIGSLQTSRGSFRVNIFYKKVGSNYFIYKLKFTNE